MRKYIHTEALSLPPYIALYIGLLYYEILSIYYFYKEVGTNSSWKSFL